MPRVFEAAFMSYYRFEIPTSVFLLDQDDPKRKDGETPGSWWVKWATFYYIDQDGKKQEIEGIKWSDEKWPDAVEEVEEEEDEDEDEDEEELSDKEKINNLMMYVDRLTKKSVN